MSESDYFDLPDVPVIAQPIPLRPHLELSSLAPPLDTTTQGVAVQNAPILHSSKVAAVLASLVPILAGAAAFLPPPFGLVAGGASLVAGLVAGAVMPQPQWLQGKALIPATAVAALLPLGETLLHLSSSMGDGYARSGLFIVGAVLLGLCGHTLPAPGATPVPEVK